MPPRRIIPGEGAKYQNVVAYKADLHLKTSESSQKLLQQLKNQALQHICKRCREKIECASSKCFFVSFRFMQEKIFPSLSFATLCFPRRRERRRRRERLTSHHRAGKFKYGKYKHKKSASVQKCQNCVKATVKLRYRKLCPPCAQETGRCPQCSKSQKEQELEDRMKRNSSGEENEEEDTTDDEAYVEEGIVITRR